MNDKVAIITPIVLQTEKMLNIYLSNLATYNPIVDTKVFLIFNRNNFNLSELLDKFNAANPKVKYDLILDVERSVAGAWNYGIYKAMSEGINLYHIVAADIAFHPNCMKILYDKIINCEYDMVSSIDFQNSYGRTGVNNEVCDFSSVMLNNKTVEKFGWFDREYKPAYFEDNDYMVRAAVSGGKFCGCLDAVHYHYGSATIKVDSEMAHHVKHWFEKNRNRFKSKWGNDTDLKFDRYHKTPYNSGKDIGWWREQDNSGYSMIGGIHES